MTPSNRHTGVTTVAFSVSSAAQRKIGVKAMRKFLSGLVVALALLPVAASAAEVDPTGRWETTSHESRYDFGFCGPAHDLLCAKLVWLNEGGMKSPAAKQLNTYVYTDGKKTGAGRWRGTLAYDGKSTAATITLTGANSLKIAGCYFILCKSFDLVRFAQ
jgi:uncharacterized protein (DUF2147 family)